MATVYNTLIELKLKPVYWQQPPTVRVGIGNDLKEYNLSEPSWFTYNLSEPPGSIQLNVEFFGKSDSDTTDTQDKAVIIDEVKLNQISDSAFVWAGIYTPIYPEPWASEQTNLQKEIPGATYIGWNGVWSLNITVPVFTWIHHQRGLGWIYD